MTEFVFKNHIMHKGYQIMKAYVAPTSIYKVEIMSGAIYFSAEKEIKVCIDGLLRVQKEKEGN